MITFQREHPAARVGSMLRPCRTTPCLVTRTPTSPNHAAAVAVAVTVTFSCQFSPPMSQERIVRFEYCKTRIKYDVLVPGTSINSMYVVSAARILVHRTHVIHVPTSTCKQKTRRRRLLTTSNQLQLGGHIIRNAMSTYIPRFSLAHCG